MRSHGAREFNAGGSAGTEDSSIELVLSKSLCTVSKQQTHDEQETYDFRSVSPLLSSLLCLVSTEPKHEGAM